MTILYFYTTLGCHLCEQAEALLMPLLLDRRFSTEMVEICDSDELMERYGIRIPVLRRADSGAEIGWPFDAQSLRQFLK